MGENLHDIDRLFRDSLDAHEEMPSEKVWEALDNNLDKSNVVQIKRKYNNLKRLAVALLLLLLGTIIYEIRSKKSIKEPFAIDKGTFKRNDKKSKDEFNNASASSTTTSASASSNKNSINNAGADSLNHTAQQAAQTPGINTTINPEKNPLGEQQHNAAVVNNNSGHKRKIKDAAGDKLADNNETFKPAVKRYSGYKAKITVKKGKAEEELVDDNNAAAQNANSNTNAAINELTRLQNNPAERINSWLQKDNNATINTKRISPDADLLNSTAKNKNLKNPKPFHFNVTAFYSPQFSSTAIKEDPNNQNNSGPGGPPGPPPGGGSTKEHFKNEEQTQRAFSTGVLVEIPVGKKWSIQSGITYLKKEISIEPKKIYAKLDKDGKAKYVFGCSSGYTYISSKTGTPAVGDSINVTASTNVLGYVGIPVAANYTFSLGKFNIIPGVGATANILVKQKIETELVQASSKEKQTINSIEGMKPVYFNAYSGISLEYNVSKRIAVNITPSGNFALSSINKNAAVKSYPNSFGIGAGIKIKL